MGDFDERLAAVRADREAAAKYLAECQTGPRWYRDDLDVTDAQIERAQRAVLTLDAYIAALEAHNVVRT